VGKHFYGLLFAHVVHDAAAKSLHIKAVNPVQYFHILEVGDSSEQREVIDEQIKANLKILGAFLPWARIVGHDRHAKKTGRTP
jgi:hypothetical protein